MKSLHAKNILKMTLVIGALTVFTFYACKKQSTNETATSHYYVQYVIKGNGAYGGFSNWTATIPQGTYSNSGTQVSSWEQTYGPVEKGFECEVQIGSYIGGSPTIEIHIAKNSEPLALKLTKTGNSATYTIN